MSYLKLPLCWCIIGWLVGYPMSIFGTGYVSVAGFIIMLIGLCILLWGRINGRH